MGQPSRDQNSILNDLFPSTPQLTQIFVARRTLANSMSSVPTQDDLTPAEVEFISKCERRRELLRSLGDNEKQVQELKESYSWESFLRELRSYVAKNWEIIVGSRGGKPRRPVKKRTTVPTAGYMEDGMSAPTFIAPVQQQQPVQPTSPGVSTALPVQTTGQPIWEAYEKARMTHLPTAHVGPAGSTVGTPGIPPPQTPVGKSSAHGTPRTAGEGNQVRRPWTKEEGTTHFKE
jgi:Telomere repeat binding factor (TRF)